MSVKFDELRRHLADIHNLDMAASLLDWDQQVNMPPGGSEARAAQQATLARLRHEMFTSDRTARLIEEAGRELDGAPFESDAASLVRVAARDLELANRLPAAFVSRLAEASSLAQPIWARARAANDFAAFRPTLERMVELKVEEAGLRGYSDHPYDAMLGQYEPGMTTADVDRIFEEHRPALVALIAAIGGKPEISEAPLTQGFDLERQRTFGIEMIRALGYDFERGRQDVSVHPFASHFSRNDVRITTRFEKEHLSPALFGMMHEAGHAMYEQGVGAGIAGTPLESGTSLGVHESQSRLWENIVGRSRGFWNWGYPRLVAAFPAQFAAIDPESFYRAINRVRPSYIRVEADEATYNLHIMVRFGIEKDLMTGALPVADLPKEWNGRFEALLGVRPPDDRHGCLQDVHWSAGYIGYFPAYALGNLLSAQYYAKALRDQPSIPDEIAAGRFSTLLSWLNTNIHQHGRKFTSAELTERVTGEPIQSRDYLAYLTTKFGEIYGL